MAGVSWGYSGRKGFKGARVPLKSGFASYNAHTMAFIYYLTQIQFDFGAVKLLKQECERVGITRPLIVTDPGVKAAGILQKALDALPGMQVAVFDQTPSNPTEAAVRAAAELYKSSGC